MPPSPFSNLNFHVLLTPGTMTFLLLVLFCVWLIHMIVMRYHWNNYGNDKLKLLQMNIFYFVGSAILFGILALSVMTYSATSL